MIVRVNISLKQFFFLRGEDLEENVFVREQLIPQRVVCLVCFLKE